MSLEILVESGIIDSLCRDLGRLAEVVFWFLTASDFFRPIFWLFGSCEIIEAPLDVFPNWPREIMALCDNFFIVRRMVCVRGGGLHISIGDSNLLESHVAVMKLIWTPLNCQSPFGM